MGFAVTAGPAKLARVEKECSDSDGRFSFYDGHIYGRRDYSGI